ncbi:YdcF family protein [Staphylococcus haemolyticus]|uniref:YdcF family protein n=4 Tax=Staphylococcus TaxID=1279 RepID=UPI00214D6A66|nr:YdcF family protein [Staphylococcus haemolyticus]
MMITMGGLLVKHNHLFSLQKGQTFLNKMTKLLILGVLFTSILAYLSTMPIPIINGVFLWLTMIAISTCYALLLYMSWSSALGRISTHKQYDLIMVLGAGIFTEKVTPMLAERLNRALSVYQHQTDKCKIIVSGGQGPDEPISEALAMQRYLIQHGVHQSSIIMESQSTNTFENFYYSKKGIHNLYSNSPNILCVTSQFHILRGMKLAHTNRMKVDGIGSHTPYHFFDVALVRDFLALMYQYKLLLTIYFAVLFFASLFILF